MRGTVVWFLIVYWLLAVHSKAQTTGVVCAYESFVGSIELSGSGRSIAIDGDTAFIAAGIEGLQIVNISDPKSPELLSTFLVPFASETVGVAIAGDYAFLAEGRRGLRVVDVSNPIEPRLVTTYRSEGPGRLNAVVIAGGIAYLAYGEDALVMLDISDPERPTFIANIGHNGAAVDVSVSRGIACLAVGPLGIELFDVSDPHNPIFLGQSSQGLRNAVSVQAVDDVLFVADSSSGLVIFDITNRSQPVQLGQVDPGSALSTHVVADHAYVATGDRFVVYDVSDPTAPIEIGVNEIHRGVRDVRVHDGLAYVVGGFNIGMLVVDVANLKPSSLIASFGGTSELWRPIALASEDNMVFVAASTGEMRAVDFSDPKSPAVISTFRTRRTIGDAINQSRLRNGLLYAANHESGLGILDVSDPHFPAWLGRFDVGRATFGIEISGNVAYLCDLDTGLWAIDVSDPDNPTLLDRYAENTLIFTASAFGSYLYVPEYNPSRLSVLDASNPSKLARIETIEMPTITGDAAFVGGYAYFPGQEAEGILIVDIAEPTKPVYVGSFGVGNGFHGIVTDGNRIYAIDTYRGMHVFDISSPQSPILIGLFGRTAPLSHITLVGNSAVVADNNFGISVVHLSDRCTQRCHADINHDGSVSPADFSAWVAAFNTMAPECDQNGDGSCTPADFGAWVLNYNAGCD